MEKKMKAQIFPSLGNQVRFDNVGYLHTMFSIKVRSRVLNRLWNVLGDEVDSKVALLRDIVKTDIHR